MKAVTGPLLTAPASPRRDPQHPVSRDGPTSRQHPPPVRARDSRPALFSGSPCSPSCATELKLRGLGVPPICSAALRSSSHGLDHTGQHLGALLSPRPCPPSGSSLGLRRQGQVTTCRRKGRNCSVCSEDRPGPAVPPSSPRNHPWAWVCLLPAQRCAVLTKGAGKGISAHQCSEPPP